MIKEHITKILHDRLVLNRQRFDKGLLKTTECLYEIRNIAHDFARELDLNHEEYQKFIEEVEKE